FGASSTPFTVWERQALQLCARLRRASPRRSLRPLPAWLPPYRRASLSTRSLIPFATLLLAPTTSPLKCLIRWGARNRVRPRLREERGVGREGGLQWRV